MVLFVPLKCEKYYHSHILSLVNEVIKSAYSETFKYLDEKAKYCETIILPIITLGGVDFYDFKRKQDNTIDLNNLGLPTTEMYKKRDSSAPNATPAYCEQPAAYVLMYLFKQATESKKLTGNKASKFIQKFIQFFQEVFFKMPTYIEFINAKEEVFKVINDAGYIHTVVHDPLMFSNDGGES